MYTHFKDFNKAFDSIHRESLWNMSVYGIPEELIILTKAMYNNFECAVLEIGETTEWFQVRCVVMQGCTMSGFLFLLSIDWVRTKSRLPITRTLRGNIEIEKGSNYISEVRGIESIIL